MSFSARSSGGFAPFAASLRRSASSSASIFARSSGESHFSASISSSLTSVSYTHLTLPTILLV